MLYNACLPKLLSLRWGVSLHNDSDTVRADIHLKMSGRIVESETALLSEEDNIQGVQVIEQERGTTLIQGERSKIQQTIDQEVTTYFIPGEGRKNAQEIEPEVATSMSSGKSTKRAVIETEATTGLLPSNRVKRRGECEKKEKRNACLTFCRNNRLILLTMVGVVIGFSVGFGVRCLRPSKDGLAWIGMYHYSSC